MWLEQSGSQSEWRIYFEHMAKTVENWTGPILCQTARMVIQDWLPEFEMDSLSIPNIIYSVFYDLLKWEIYCDDDNESTLEVSLSPQPVSFS